MLFTFLSSYSIVIDVDDGQQQIKIDRKILNLNWNYHCLSLLYTLIYCFIRGLDTYTSTITLKISFLDRCLVHSVLFHNNEKLLFRIRH